MSNTTTPPQHILSVSPLQHQIHVTAVSETGQCWQEGKCDTRGVNRSAGVEDEDHGGGCERAEQGNEPHVDRHASNVQVCEVW